MIKVGLITIADSREDFFTVRKPLIKKELEDLEWLRESFAVIESEILNSESEIKKWIPALKDKQPDCLIVHLPIWADPVFSILISNLTDIPILLMGNDRKETSSLVGLLGAGGALDQIGQKHQRIFDHRDLKNQNKIKAFAKAAHVKEVIKGMTMGMYGSRSLGIFTTVCDPAQWHKLFGIDVKVFDQSEIMLEAESIDSSKVREYVEWVKDNVKSISFDQAFTIGILERQVKSYLATEQLVSKNHLDFVCVKCQQELSDGYTTQCLSHMLMNGTLNKLGRKPTTIHACESDADGALTMLLLSKLSGDSATALLDVRNIDFNNNTLILANCGAVAHDFFSRDENKNGLNQVQLMPHIFGKAGGCACSSIIEKGEVTLARLCRKQGEYYMTVIVGEAVIPKNGELESVTPQFPKGLIKVSLTEEFVQEFGSNHLHMVRGNLIDELEILCKFFNIKCRVWK